MLSTGNKKKIWPFERSMFAMQSKKLIVLLLAFFCLFLFLSQTAYADEEDEDISIEKKQLQYRTYSDSTHVFSGWFSAEKDDEPIPSDIVEDVKLIFLDDNKEIEISFSFYESKPYSAWINQEGEFEYDGTFPYAGYMIRDMSELEDGDYQYQVSTEDGTDIKSDEFNYPGQEESPTVPRESVGYTWLDDGSLNLEWQRPEDLDFDELKLQFYDSDNDDKNMLTVALSPGEEEITVPSDLINKMQGLYPEETTSMLLQMRTESYSEEDMVYARGITGVDIPVEGDVNGNGDDNGDDNGLSGCTVNPGQPFGLEWLILGLIGLGVYMRRLCNA